RVTRRGEDGAYRGYGHEHEDHRRCERPTDLERGVTVRGLRSRTAFAVAEPDQGDEEQGLDEDEHDHGPPEYVGEQLIDRTTEIGPRPQRGLWEGAGTAAQGEGGGGQPEATARHGVAGPQVTLPLRPPHPGTPGSMDAGARASAVSERPPRGSRRGVGPRRARRGPPGTESPTPSRTRTPAGKMRTPRRR